MVQSTKPDTYQKRNGPPITATYKSERMLLNVMFFNIAAYKLAKVEITQEEFSDETHKHLFSKIIEFKESNESTDAGAFLSSVPESLKPHAAEILYKEYAGDAQDCAKDTIDKIKKYNFNQKINRLAKEGRLNEVNELIASARKENTNDRN